ncbi:MAG: trypsin-like peptidase domain-containing protein [Pseudomonadota bacterium]
MGIVVSLVATLWTISSYALSSDSSVAASARSAQAQSDNCVCSTPAAHNSVSSNDDDGDPVEQLLRATVAIDGNGVYGAGILIDPRRGLILTSHHVVEDMRKPLATMKDGRASEAVLIASNRKLDLAVLSAPGLKSTSQPPPRLGDPTKLRPGEEVFTIGSPRQLPFTVTRGIVSFVDRPMEEARYLQLDMAINEGNSGGPVFNSRGEIVAVMSFILKRAQGLSFALPISYVTTAFSSSPEL